MKPFIKISCLLLSVVLFLNSAGFAAMVNCDGACCQPASTASSPDNQMSCHDDEETMELQSESANQMTTWTSAPMPETFVQCGSSEVILSFDPKRSLTNEIIISKASKPGITLLSHGSCKGSTANSSPFALSSQIICPLLI